MLKLRSVLSIDHLAAFLTASIGIVALMGWILGLPLLKSVIPGAVEMKANTAIALIASAAALFLLDGQNSHLSRNCARLLALAVALLGLATLGEYVLGWQFGIDELLFSDTGTAYNAIRGRMSPYSTVAFVSIGFALLALPYYTLRPAIWLAVSGLVLIGSVSLIGYLWNASELVTSEWLPPVAVHTALAFILLAAGISNVMFKSVARSKPPLLALSHIELKVLAGIVFSLLLLLLGGGLTYRATVQSDSAAQWVAHTQDVRVSISDLYRSISDAETSQRNYLVTGQKKFGDDYRRQTTRIDGQLLLLLDFVSDNDGQVENLTRLRQLVTKKMQGLTSQMSLYDQHDITFISKYVGSDEGAAIMEAISATIKQMDVTERELLLKRQKAFAGTRQITLLSLLLTLVVLAGVFIIQFQAIRREITARKLVEVHLQDSNARIQSVVDAAADGIITMNKHGVIETFNPAAERIFGYAATEVIGANINLLMYRADVGKGKDATESRRINVLQMVTAEHEVVGKHKNGSVFAIEMATREMWLGTELHYTSTVRNIEARKNDELALLAAKDAAVKANNAKDMFLATMSHEVRTSLNGLLGMLELLGLSRLDAEQRETLGAARYSGRSLVRIIDDVLDHTKIEAGKLQICPEPVAVEQVLDRVLDNYHSVASAMGTTLTKILDPRISPMLVADPLRLSQILGNFVSNATKFTTAGRVAIRAELVKRENLSETVRFSVRDTGIGMAREVQDRLFQPFEHTDSDTPYLYGGTGLGLAICRRLAEMMGGAISIESTVGVGTTAGLTLTLPISDVAPADYANQQEADLAWTNPGSSFISLSPGETPWVLAVDDNSTNRKLLASQLATFGLSTETAAGGMEALSMWKDGKFTIIITDCNMPELDGYALTRAIREIEAQEGRRRTLIIAWTANVLSGASDKCRMAGMDDMLSKPAELAQLHQMLSKWLPTAPSNPDLQNASRAPTETAANKPMDVSALKALVGDDPALIREFLEEFRISAAKITEELNDACEAGNSQMVGASAHKLKSSARAVGARALSDLCEEMEVAGNANQSERLVVLHPRFIAEMSKVDKYLVSFQE